jgi:hypothetical protein
MLEELIMRIPARRKSIRGALIAIALIACLPAQPLSAQTTAQELGSSRNTRIAFPMESGPVELTYLARSMEQEDLAELRRVAPNLRVVTGLSRPGPRDRRAVLLE